MPFRSLLAICAVVQLAGCQVALEQFERAERIEHEPVVIENTSYEIYERVRRSAQELDRPSSDPRDQSHFYAIVGQGSTVYCGNSRSGCEAAIRRFNNNQQRSEEMM